MGPTAKSRKGKKAWRKNIDVSEVEASLEEKTYQERRGPAAAELKDDQLFFVDTVEAADSDDEEEGDEGGEAGAFDPNAIALTGADGDSDGEGPGTAAKRKVEKKSKKERSKEARRKAADLEAGERKKLKAQRRELHTLREVKEQLEDEKQLQDTKRERLQSLRAERAAVEPPRLGKLRFEAPAVQVLTSDEATGSLRQVLPCAMLAADRFKSLQQRGLVEPRKPQPFKERRSLAMSGVILVVHVVAACRDPAGAAALQRLLLAEAPHTAGGGGPSYDAVRQRLHIVQLDVCDEDSIQRAAEEVSGLVDGLDLLLNCSGVLHSGPAGMAPAHRVPATMFSNPLRLPLIYSALFSHAPSPNAPAARSPDRRKVGYEKGGRSERQEAASDEVRAMGRQNKKARLAAKAVFAAQGGDDWL
ncbi:hypothetical protein TSOC_006602 [Tetrabaena socialis]|uniref:Ribosome biogenesis protein NOP53 n=1 Tax=Tetrabaena socialis TaxID=47790 RepID=A0A2J8A389_9CHLO|nr:hypothetical protein TSOC_006602 [Tetrabaena socialis]|eukprot:PNH06989.1 hypothetical protein TSOC_006602 [Tetrabaena socialis]